MPKIGETKAAAVTWEPKKVTIQAGKSHAELSPRKVAALIHGAFAVHPCVMEPRLFALSHVKTGLRILSVKTEADAKRVGEYLWRKFCLVFRAGAKEDIKGKLPPGIEPWLKKMNNETAAWIDPPDVG